MAAPKKIATCSYCGTRAVLVLDKARHELTCRACGAPLHDMKFMPQPVEKKSKNPSSEKPITAANFRSKKKPKKKKRKSVFAWALEELWDEVEDIFD